MDIINVFQIKQRILVYQRYEKTSSLHCCVPHAVQHQRLSVHRDLFIQTKTSHTAVELKLSLRFCRFLHSLLTPLIEQLYSPKCWKYSIWVKITLLWNINTPFLTMFSHWLSEAEMSVWLVVVRSHSLSHMSNFVHWKPHREANIFVHYDGI